MADSCDICTMKFIYLVPFNKPMCHNLIFNPFGMSKNMHLSKYFKAKYLKLKCSSPPNLIDHSYLETISF